MIWITEFLYISPVKFFSVRIGVFYLESIIAGGKGPCTHPVGVVVKMDTISRIPVDVCSTFTEQGGSVAESSGTEDEVH
jgi:hypothetical protein